MESTKNTENTQNTYIYNINLNIYKIDLSDNVSSIDNNIVKMETFNNTNINSNNIKFDNLNIYISIC